MGWAKISGPKNSSMQPDRFSFSVAGFVYNFSKYLTIYSSQSFFDKNSLPFSFLISDKRASGFAHFAILMK